MLHSHFHMYQVISLDTATAARTRSIKLPVTANKQHNTVPGIDIDTSGNMYEPQFDCSTGDWPGSSG